MKYIMEHYGAAILVSLTLLALGGVVILLCNGNGFVATQFQDALKSFFSSMNGLNGGGA